MKRFYKIVSTRRESGGFNVCLDGKPVKVPSGALLLMSSENLADEIAREWAGQEGHIVPDSMPLTQILTTKIDRVSKERAAMTDALMKYIDTDLLCYLAENPQELAVLHEERRGRWLKWFEGKYGFALRTTTGISALKQDKGIRDVFLKCLDLMTDDEFTVFQLVVSASGSLVLGLAFCEGEMTPEQVFEAVHLEEHHKAEIYNEDLHGPDPMEEKKYIAMQTDLAAAAKFLALA